MYYSDTEDKYFNSILEKLIQFVPEFKFDDDDPAYPVLFEFFLFMEENINNKNVLKKCFDFVNDAVLNGSDTTEDAIVLQIFHNIYYNKDYMTMARAFLNEKSQAVFDESYGPWLKDFGPL
jgi:hypothetical protein